MRTRLGVAAEAPDVARISSSATSRTPRHRVVDSPVVIVSAGYPPAPGLIESSASSIWRVQ
jgi:hypothetical protein